ncbi:MAG: FAD-dependent oxidoreductase [Calditrichia bacterium]
MITSEHPVIIVGAGPVGLAAAAHLIKRGQQPLLLEAGNKVGATIQTWRHVRMFSPWKLALDEAAVSILEPTGWQKPDLKRLPTGGDLIDNYLQPLAETAEMQKVLRYNHRVVSVGRDGTDKIKSANREKLPFKVLADTPNGRVTLFARAIIDTSGTWNSPNPAGADGYPAEGEKDAEISYGIPDVYKQERKQYAGKRTLVIGSGHSAINTLLDLAKLTNEVPETEIVWAIRRDNMQSLYGGEANDELPARGLLGTRLRELVESKRLTLFTGFSAQKIVAEQQKKTVYGTAGSDGIMIENLDNIIVATGQRPDFSFLREVRLSIDSALESSSTLGPMIDPNVHSCGTVPPHGEAELRHPEPGFYIAGIKSYGRAPTFLLATGYEQVRSITAFLCGDEEAARNVQLSLPETGACCTDQQFEEERQVVAATIGSSCCGTTEKVEATSENTAEAPTKGGCCG